MNKEIKINYVAEANNFIGFNIEKDGVVFYVPQVFRKEINYKTDLVLLLKSISLAKTIEKENNKRANYIKINSNL